MFKNVHKTKRINVKQQRNSDYFNTPPQAPAAAMKYQHSLNGFSIYDSYHLYAKLNQQPRRDTPQLFLEQPCEVRSPPT
jgi:hypothetical protein